jgi:hypothetical protein
MANVHSSCLKLGQTFPDRELIILHVAEKKNLVEYLFPTTKTMTSSCTTLVPIHSWCMLQTLTQKDEQS